MKSKGSVQRYIPLELDALLNEFHMNYTGRFSAGNEEAITRTFTDRLFAHMYSKMVLETLGKGKITITPKGKSKSRCLEINYDFNL